jgi:hypothetical protein
MYRKLSMRPKVRENVRNENHDLIKVINKFIFTINVFLNRSEKNSVNHTSPFHRPIFLSAVHIGAGKSVLYLEAWIKFGPHLHLSLSDLHKIRHR